MAENRRLQDFRRATLNASGTATVTFGPSLANVRYLITRVGVTGPSTMTAIPTARLYRGSANAANYLGGTFVGNDDSDDQLQELLYQGEVLTVQWQGGDVGAVMTASFFGSEIQE